MLSTFDVIPDLVILPIEACILVSLTGDEQRWALKGVKSTSIEVVITWRDRNRDVDSWIGVTDGQALAFLRQVWAERIIATVSTGGRPIIEVILCAGCSKDCVATDAVPHGDDAAIGGASKRVPEWQVERVVDQSA